MPDSALAGNSHGWHKYASASKIYYHCTPTAEDTASAGPGEVVWRITSETDESIISSSRVVH